MIYITLSFLFGFAFGIITSERKFLKLKSELDKITKPKNKPKQKK